MLLKWNLNASEINVKFDEQILKEKGYTQDKQGNWTKPNAFLGKLEAGKHGKPARTLDNNKQKKPGSTRGRTKGSRRKRPPEIIVTMTAHLPRYMDDDNLGNALKPVQDALALWLSVDDRDWIVAWECDQTLTRGFEGVCVAVQKISE